MLAYVNIGVFVHFGNKKYAVWEITTKFDKFSILSIYKIFIDSCLCKEGILYDN